jgi:diaminopimelate epimerase
LIPFVKANACGNDFLIVDASFALSRRLCARHTGVGADGVEWVTAAAEKSVSARLFNADGSEAEISGNGTRCVAAWLAIERDASTPLILTGAGPRHSRVISRDGNSCEIETAMGTPRLSAKSVLLAKGDSLRGKSVSIGNPHFVIFCQAFPRNWSAIGAEVAVHSDFPHGTNVEFVRIVDTTTIEIRIFERGAGVTESSGTGSCAAAAAAIAEHHLARELNVRAPGGTQRVRWEEGGELFLTGTAEIVARGEAF